MRDSGALRPTPLWLLLMGTILALFGTVAGRYWDFTVDDAGISFAAARSLGSGYGMVLFRDGERVEAATNLLWVLLLTPARWLGLTHELLAKLLGLGGASLALFCVGLFPSAAYQRRPRYFDLVAPLLAALMPHFALWTVSGLESGLMAGLLAASLLALAWEEADPRRTPWSSLLLCAAFATRPDGLLYLAAVGTAKLLRQLVPRPRRQDLLWGVLVVAVLGSLELCRLAYFAWPFPNSYYTKRRTWEFGKDLFDTSTAGWAYVGTWVEQYKLRRLFYLLPAILLGRGAPAPRLALLGSIAAALFFPIYSHGDWMEEFRFLSWASPLVCLGFAEAARAVLNLLAATASMLPGLDALAKPLTWLATPVVAVALLREGAQHYPERMRAAAAHNTLEFSHIRGRARYFINAARRLQIDGHAGLPSLLDPDIGGLTYDGRLRVVDLFGLGEVTLAQQHPQNPSGTREFLFWERRPDFVHLHGAWFQAVEIDRLEELQELYVRLPAQVDGESEYGNNYVRREAVAAPWYAPASLLSAPPSAGPDGFTLSHHGAEPGGTVLAELTLAGQSPNGIVLLQAQGRGASQQQDAAAGSGVLGSTVFTAGERPRVRVAFRNLVPGRYAVTYRDPTGRELSLGSVEVARGASANESRTLREQMVRALEQADFTRALLLARTLGLRAVAAPTDALTLEALGLYGRALGQRARSLATQGAPGLAAVLARQARAWAWHDHGTIAQSEAVAEVLYDASRARQRQGALQEAFTLARDSVLVDPRRSWGRRRAEELRAGLVSRYDGGRELLAWRLAVASAATGTEVDAALEWLGVTERIVEAAGLAERLAARGLRPSSGPARVAVARGLVARGQWTEALAMVAQLPCSEAHDPELTRALRAAFHGRYRAGDAACEAPLPRRGPWDAAQGSFESATFRGWTRTGTAFGALPVRERPTGQQYVNGFHGFWYASSFRTGSDEARGTLRSAPFTVRAPAVSFLVGGGSNTARSGVRLLVGGRSVREAGGQDNEGLRRVFWDVREFQGQSAAFEVYDQTGGAWGHVLADDFGEEPGIPAAFVTGASSAPPPPAPEEPLAPPLPGLPLSPGAMLGGGHAPRLMPAARGLAP